MKDVKCCLPRPKEQGPDFSKAKVCEPSFFRPFLLALTNEKGKVTSLILPTCPLLQLFSLPFPSKMMKEVFGRIGKHYSPTISYLFPRSRTFFSSRVSLLSRVRVRTVDNTRTGLFFGGTFLIISFSGDCRSPFVRCVTYASPLSQFLISHPKCKNAYAFA